MMWVNTSNRFVVSNGFLKLIERNDAYVISESSNLSVSNHGAVVDRAHSQDYAG